MRIDRLGRALAHPWTEYQVTKAKSKHRKLHPNCIMCGRAGKFFGRGNDVHHEVPVHIRPDLACDPRNLLTLCRVHHFTIGHLEDWKDWCINIGTVIAEIKRVYTYIARSGS
jgi:hypothetical protein